MAQEQKELIAARLGGQTPQEYIKYSLTSLEDAHCLDRAADGMPISPEGRPTPPLPKDMIIATLKELAGDLGFDPNNLTSDFLNRFDLSREDLGLHPQQAGQESDK